MIGVIEIGVFLIGERMRVRPEGHVRYSEFLKEFSSDVAGGWSGGAIPLSHCREGLAYAKAVMERFHAQSKNNQMSHLAAMYPYRECTSQRMV